MKRILTMAIATAIAVTANAQAHFKFMGIPIDGNQTYFAGKLIAKGFKKAEEGHNYIGTFNGKVCTIDLASSSKSRTMYGVCVNYPQSSNIAVIRNQYEDLKKALLNKYDVVDSCEDILFENEYLIEKEIEEKGGFADLLYLASKDDTGGVIIMLGKEIFSFGLSLIYMDLENKELQQIENNEDL